MSDTSTPIIPAALPFTLPGNDIGVVIVHGYGGSIADYRAIGERLHEQGYTVHGVRLAGHGQGQTALRASTIEGCQQTVRDAVDDVRRTCKKIFLLGSSFGGVLCLDYARHAHVDGLVLVNTALSYSGAGVFQGFLLRLLRIVTPDYKKPGLTDDERSYAASIGSSEAWPINGILATSKFAHQEIIPALSQILAPALIMRSTDDPVVGTKNSERLAALLGSSTKQLITIPVETHRPFRHQQANDFMAKNVQRFIQEVLAK